VNALALFALAVVAAAATDILLPGRALYHDGWFCVSIAAVAIFAIFSARRAVRRGGSAAAIVAVAFGAAIAGFAVVASGLLAPDDRTVVGAPGTDVRVDDLGGSLVFPFAQASPRSDVVLARTGHAPLPVGLNHRYVSAFVLREIPRIVLFVQARDARGGNLTITQPNGVAFLSPVLLMQQHQPIPGTGLDVPYDAFAVPAAHRLVKAVLFSPEQAATMPGLAGIASYAVLFDATDEDDRSLPNGFGVAPAGRAVRVGGISLTGRAIVFPAVEIDAIPSLPAVALGAALVFGGLVAGWRIGAPETRRPEERT